MNINSSQKPHTFNQRPSTPSAPAPEQTEEQGSSILDKVVTGAKVAGLSMIPGLGGYGVLRPLAFQVGLSGDGAYRAMDAATLMNYASIPLLATSLVFPQVGLAGAGVCLAASAAAGLYGANAVGAFD